MLKVLKTLLIIAALSLILLTSNGCTSRKDEGFAIYLTRQDIPVATMPVLSHVELADEPIISTDDIISYQKETHEIKLTSDAYERLAELDVPVQGKAFLVCVDRSPIYWGAFWPIFSSLSFDGVVILVPGLLGRDSIQIGLGYPSPGFFTGEDIRDNPIIWQSLEKAGKLK